MRFFSLCKALTTIKITDKAKTIGSLAFIVNVGRLPAAERETEDVRRTSAAARAGVVARYRPASCFHIKILGEKVYFYGQKRNVSC